MLFIVVRSSRLYTNFKTRITIFYKHNDVIPTSYVLYCIKIKIISSNFFLVKMEIVPRLWWKKSVVEPGNTSKICLWFNDNVFTVVDLRTFLTIVHYITGCKLSCYYIVTPTRMRDDYEETIDIPLPVLHYEDSISNSVSWSRFPEWFAIDVRLYRLIVSSLQLIAPLRTKFYV